MHKCLRVLSDQDAPETFAEFKKKQAEAEEKSGKKNGGGMVSNDAQVPITSE